jgi:Ca2+-binding RTX toxin-like protein
VTTIIGTDLNDVIVGTTDADRIESGAGNDRINGSAGDDEIFGGTGNDTLTGDAGNDRIFGEDGNDGIYGGGGNDHIDGGAGDDTLIGDGGDDVIFGGTGRDKLYGGVGNDRLDGGLDDDLLFGDAGDDVFVYRPGEGNDVFVGGLGNDRLELQLTTAQLTDELRADLLAYNAWAANQLAQAGSLSALASQSTGDAFTFNSLGITISSVQGLTVLVDGTEVVLNTLIHRPPTEIFLSNSAIDEGVVAGTLVGHLSGIDPDVGQSATLIFSLAEPSDYFEIVSNEILVKAGAVLDFEVGSQHSVKVTATDVTGLTRTQTLKITVNNVDEAFTGSVNITGYTAGTNSAVLSAAHTIGDPDGIVGGVTFQWQVSSDGGETWSNIAGASGSSYTPSGIAVGSLVRVTAVYADMFGNKSVASTDQFIIGTSASNTITGTAHADTILGLSGNDTIVGFTDHDTVDGGAGTDTIRLAATAENLNNASDEQILNVEAISASGAQSAVVLDLGRQTEGFTITATRFADVITGSSGADAISAGSSADRIIGFVGADRLNGGSGRDTLEILATSADLNSAGDARLVSIEVVTAQNAAAGVTLSLANQTEGFTIIGTAFADTITGGQGNDTFTELTAGDVLDGAGGTDTLRLMGSLTALNAAADDQISKIEVVTFSSRTEGVGLDISRQTEGFTITATSFADVITGSSGADAISAGSGDDRIIGFAGADRLNGGSGRDTLEILATSADLNSASNDQLVSVEVVTATNAASGVVINLTNQTEGFSIVGSGFADKIRGGMGRDTISAGDGDDVIYGITPGDVINGGMGHDTVVLTETPSGLTAVSNAQIENVEAVTAASAAAGVTIDLSRQTEGFAVTGSGWSDVLTGSAGNDVILGGAGSDTIRGGAGADVLYGGDGADVFMFARLTDSGATAATRDIIGDFVRSQQDSANHDIIDLSAIDAIQGGADQAFVFNPTAWNGVGKQFTGAGQLGYQFVTDEHGVAKTIISGNVNGNLAADFQIELMGHGLLTAGDFVL